MCVRLKQLDKLIDVPFEQWPKHGVRLKAVSANANGIVTSGILLDGTYFYRQQMHDYIKDCDASHFVIGDK